MSSSENPFVSGQPVGHGEIYAPFQFPIPHPVSTLSDADLRHRSAIDLMPDLYDEETRFEVARQLIEAVIGEPYKDEDITNGWATLFNAHVRIFDALDPNKEGMPGEDAPTMREQVEAELFDAYQKYSDIKEAAATPTAGPSIRYASAQDYMKENGGTWPWYYRALDWLNSPRKD